jgi:glycosyltransferase involved in cell wall biosynthesis
MKVAVLAPSPVPFLVGGAESAWLGLYTELFGREGVEAELIKVPSPERSLPEVMASYERWSSLRADQFDKVIVGKYPAWMVEHPYKVLYMLHPLRGLYDTYGGQSPQSFRHWRSAPVRRLVTAAAGLSRGAMPADVYAAWRNALDALGPGHPAFAFPGPLARLLVRALDRWALHPRRTRSWTTISRTVADREGYFQDGQRADAVPHPSTMAGLHHTDEQAFFFTASRLDPPKRLDLVIAAYRTVEGNVPLLIAGSGPDEARLRDLSRDDPRIRLVGRLSEQSLADHYARCLAVVFVPLQEDLGLITLEAMMSGKPVLTVRDSGGPNEFVSDGETGVVTDPDPQSLAEGFRRLLSDRPSAAAMGRNGLRVASQVTWGRVADHLLRRPAPVAPVVTAHGRRPKAVVLATFAVDEPRGGGQLRTRHLSAGLLERFDVDVVSLTDPRHRRRDVQIAEGFRQRTVPRSGVQEQRTSAVNVLLGANVEDVLAGALVNDTPEYLNVVANSLGGASAAVLSHPFLVPALEAARGASVPVLYDAHNVELDLKKVLLEAAPHRDASVDLVRDIEEAAFLRSSAVTCTSDQDEARLSALYGTPPCGITVVPNGVDLTTTPFVCGAQRARLRAQLLSRLAPGGPEPRVVAGFVGSSHPPNTEAVLRLAAMADDDPGVLVLVVGSVCWSVPRSELPPNVLPLGLVSDEALALVLGGIDVALNPITTGAGTNLKLVQYLASGAPVITTPFGARGVDLPDDVVLLREVEEFPPALRGLPAGLPSSERLKEGRRIAETFSWPVLAARFAAVVESMEVAR